MEDCWGAYNVIKDTCYIELVTSSFILLPYWLTYWIGVPYVTRATVIQSAN